jgi:hypothetical protein
MIDRRRSGRRVLATMVAMLVSSAALAAAPSADRDAHEVDAYVLTDAALTKYAQATKKLQALPRRATAKCDDSGDDASGNGTSIAAQVAKLESTPGAAAAVMSTGLSTREYVVFTWSLLEAGMASWAVAQPGAKQPTGVLKSNVAFYRAHEAVLKAIAPASDSSDCEDERDSDR